MPVREVRSPGASWGAVGLRSYPWALLAPFLGAQAACESPGYQRYLVYKDKAWGVLNLLWLFCNIFFEQGLVLIWLRNQSFESPVAEYP